MPLPTPIACAYVPLPIPIACFTSLKGFPHQGQRLTVDRSLQSNSGATMSPGASYSQGSRTAPCQPPSLEERKNRKSSFKKEKTMKLIVQRCSFFQEEAKRTDHPRYCPYHRMISHPIEDCYVFKDWVEKQYQGRGRLSKNVLLDKPSEHTNLVTVAQGNEEVFWEEKPEALRPPEIAEGVWQLVISKKSRKLFMFKAVNNMTGIRWRRVPQPEESSSKPTQKKKGGRKSSKGRKAFCPISADKAVCPCKQAKKQWESRQSVLSKASMPILKQRICDGFP